MVWIAVILGLVVGMVAGGWQSLRLAREGDLKKAQGVLRRAAILAAGCGVLLTVPTLGWPFKAVTVSAPEEVTRTVVETVEVPVTVTRWFPLPEDKDTVTSVIGLLL